MNKIEGYKNLTKNNNNSNQKNIWIRLINQKNRINIIKINWNNLVIKINHYKKRTI